MLKRKPLIIAIVAAVTMGATAVSSEAHANDSELLGAVVGAGIGLAIGHSLHSRDGAIVGGVIGAIAGASNAAGSSYRYGTGYYAAPVTVYTPAPAYVDTVAAYYQAAPIYYSHPRFAYAPRADSIHYGGARYFDRDGIHGHGSRDVHDHDGNHGR